MIVKMIRTVKSVFDHQTRQSVLNTYISCGDRHTRRPANTK